MRGISFIACFLLVASAVVGQYSPPRAKVEPIFPRGIRISVPHEDGITLVAFHVQFNKDFEGLEAGTIARDVVKVRDGRWTYQDRTTKLKLGDIVYYWVHVVYEGLGYNLLDQQHQVTEYFTPEGVKVNTGSETKQPDGNNQPCAPTDSKLVDLSTGLRKDICAGQLLLEDQFDVLNETLWRQVERFTASPDYAFVVYRNDRRNVNTNNGQLNIVPTLTKLEYGTDFIRHGNLTLERCTGEYGTRDCHREAVGAYILPPVLSASLETKNSFAFLYGKIEIRAKLPRGDWIYPVIGLEPLETYSSTSYPQLRVASSYGNAVLRGAGGKDLSGRVLCGGAVEANTGAGRSVLLPRRYAIDLWSDDYHVYELEWRRDRILSRVDGLEYGSTETRTPFDRPFFLKLGVAVGGHDEFPDLSTSNGYTKPWRNVGSKALFDFFNATDLWANSWVDGATSLKIDYIKVWAL